MRPADLPPVEKLGSHKPHGHKMRYMAGCRCKRCRDGNSRYEAKMQRDREKFGPNDLVPVDAVRDHVMWLRTQGMGPKTIGRVAGVSKTGLNEILFYQKAQMRRRTANRVLAVQPTLENLPKTHKILAGETLGRLRQLARWGIPYTTIARDALGSHHPLQISALRGKTETVAVKTALKIREYFQRVERMRSIWLALGRAIPRRHYVYWKRGCHGFTIRSFELVEFCRNYEFQHLYPAELKEAIRCRNQLRSACRVQRRNNRGKKNNSGAQGSSIRNHGVAYEQGEAYGRRPRQGNLPSGLDNHRISQN